MMELYRIREVDFQHKDVRGCLTQLIHSGYAQVNVLESKKGATRGTHFHREATEAFYLIVGSVETVLVGKDSSERVVFQKGDFFEIPPNVLHNMMFLEESLMVQMYSIPVEREDGTKDFFVEEEFYA